MPGRSEQGKQAQSALVGWTMSLEVVETHYGVAALAALRKRVAAEKAQDPLAPVSMLVPNNIAGLFVRRHLARGVTDGRPGIAGVFISTLPATFAPQQVAAASLYPRTPATATVLAAAWRAVLDETPGIFGPVADHPATIRALTSAHRELRDLSDVALDAISGMSPLHAGLIDLHRSATERISRAFYDEADVLTACTSLVLAQAGRTRDGGVGLCCICRSG